MPLDSETPLAPFMRFVVIAALFTGCSALQEAVESPEQAAARAERGRQVGLPLAEASCAELQRRANRAADRILEGTNAAYYRAAINELVGRCWTPSLAETSCEEIQRRADRAADNLLQGTNAAFYKVAILALEKRCW